MFARTGPRTSQDLQAHSSLVSVPLLSSIKLMRLSCCLLLLLFSRALSAGDAHVVMLDMNTGDDLISLWNAVGNCGAFVLPVFLAFVIGMGFAIERISKLKRRLHLPLNLEKDVVQAVDMRGTDAGMAVCLEKKSSLGRVIRAFLLRQGGTRMELEAAVRHECAAVRFELLQNTRWIGLMALLAVMCGLLGSGIALNLRFEHISTFADGNYAALLANAVSAALPPAVLGLLAAIPLVFAYFRLRASADELAHQIEEKGVSVMLMLDRKARQSIRLIEDIEDQIKTKDMPGVKVIPPDLAAEFDDHQREGSGVKSGITTPAHLPVATDENVKRKN